MITCPWCGSSAQISQTHSYEMDGDITQGYLCGCGCRFVRQYHLYNIEIVTIEK